MFPKVGEVPAMIRPDDIGSGAFKSNNPAASEVRRLFLDLKDHYGPQHWWPADSRFEIMIGAVLVQRTTWTSAAAAVERLRAAGGLACNTLALMTVRRLEPHLRGAGFFRRKAVLLIALAQLVRAHGGVRGLDRLDTPSLRSLLLSMDGIGPETADTILLYAFDRPVFVVDAYALRLIRRLGITLPDSPPHLQGIVAAELGDAAQLNEFHALIVEHGKRHCRAKPQCTGCCLRNRCASQLAGKTSQPCDPPGQVRADI
jgi:endonuclease III related protein